MTLLQHLWRTVIATPLVLLFSFVAHAQIEGVVLDASTRTPVSVVTVRAIREGKTIDFATSDDKGVFILKKAKAPVRLSFRHLSYAKMSVDITSGQRTEYLLTAQATELKNVTVHAARVELRGDTTSYLVNQYASQKDITLGDALKKMPGIEISKGGTVSYLGKSIDKLKIDGKELLGRDYDIAIRNLRHSSVARVEIMERQQEVKALKGLVADDKLIMNLVLNRSSRGRLNGNIEAGVGAEKSGVDYLGGLSLLHFLGKMQTVASGYYQKDFSAYVEEKRLTFEDPTYTSAVEPLLSSGIGASVPGVSDEYFRHKKGGKGSVHTAWDLGRERSMRINAAVEDFSYLHSYGNDITYFTPDQPELHLSESDVVSEMRNREARVSLTYNQNSDKAYFNNKLTYIGYETSRVGTFVRPESYWVQSADHQSHVVDNQWRSLLKLGNKVIHFSSHLAAEFYPRMNLLVGDEGQHLEERILRGALSSFYLHPIGRDWNLRLPLSYSVSNDQLHLDDERLLKGLSHVASFAPVLSYMRGLNNFSFTLPVSYRHYSFRPVGQGDFRRGYWNVEPYLSLRYTFTPEWSLYATARMTRAQGDITDFIMEPMRISYRTAYSGIGTLMETYSQSLLANLFYKKPLKELYSNLMVSYSHHSLNLMMQDFPAEEVNVQSKMIQPNDRSNLTVHGNISKNFRTYHTKVTGDIWYSLNRSMLVRQGKMGAVDSQSLNGKIGVMIEPTDYFELSYDVRLGTSRVKYGGWEMRGLLTLHQKMSVDVVPSSNWAIGLNAEHLMKEVKTNDYSHLFLMGVSGQYKSGAHVVKVDLSNLLNQQEYRFALYDGATMYDSWYRLRGLSGLVSYRYYF